MKINNLIFLPVVLPFICLYLFQFFWWVAGAAYSPDVNAVVSLAVGGICGFLAMIAGFEKKADIGHFYIGKRKG